MGIMGDMMRALWDTNGNHRGISEEAQGSRRGVDWETNGSLRGVLGGSTVSERIVR